ncbi:glycoside hydrolase family 108 protein [Mucilaginibacter agri]|uniref:N-acetylmuramidase n=1 Tax=Mucilaginibacter agri TaxID=2695265 RepID=A0A965ZH99_9SPHI|nr:glycosyl hydrolase 108 family protein [Mucilaginibacter agri]NCD71058.1 hypothetical protein [Mucilaginibacter agri]
MAQFNPAFQITMGNEGGYANNPHDAGGETYKGVAKNFWPHWEGWSIIDPIIAKKPASINQALNANAPLQTMILSFYKANFWDTESLDNIKDQQIANQLFDIAVNMGTGIASRFLQQAVNKLSPDKLKVDGQIGSLSISAANAEDAEDLYNTICQLRRGRYEAIIQSNPSQQRFANSWFSRITPYQA